MKEKKPEDKIKKSKTAVSEIKRKIVYYLSLYFKWLILIISGLILILGIIFFVIPKYNEIREFIRVNEGKNIGDLNEATNYLEKLNDLITIYQKIDTVDIENIKSMLPEENIKEDLFTELESIITKNGLLVKSIIINEPEGETANNNQGRKINESQTARLSLPKDIKKIKINLTVVGTNYFSFKNLLKALEKNLRIIDITNLEFSPEGETITLGLETYYLNSQD
ncbi:MAG: hypothetical protein ABIG60_05515 [Patescibacteria group bacterium]